MRHLRRLPGSRNSGVRSSAGVLIPVGVEIYEMGRIGMSLKGQEITNEAFSDFCFS